MRHLSLLPLLLLTLGCSQYDIRPTAHGAATDLTYRPSYTATLEQVKAAARAASTAYFQGATLTDTPDGLEVATQDGSKRAHFVFTMSRRGISRRSVATLDLSVDSTQRPEETVEELLRLMRHYL